MERKHVEEVAKMVRDFLKENGGYDNGYDTFMNATFRLRNKAWFEWFTPPAQDHSRREMRALGTILEDQVLKYLEANQLSEAIKVYSVPADYGAFKVFITFIPDPVEMPSV